MCQRSRLGSPSTIHSATTLPIPPAPASPWAQKPAQTKKPSTSLSPRQNSLSGVNASGPLISLVTVISFIAGTRRLEFSVISSKRSHSSSSRRPLKSAGIALDAAGPVRHEGRFALALVAAHHQAVAVLAVVDEQVGVAQGGEAAALAAVAVAARASRDRLERLGHQVLVGEGDQRHADAGHAADLGRVHAAGVDHDLGLDLAAVGAHAAHAAVADLDPGHPGRR